MRVELVSEITCDLGEAPLWIPETEELVWLDINGQRLHRLRASDEQTAMTLLPEMVTALGLCADEGFVVATRVGFGRMDAAGTLITPLARAVISRRGDRMNDGAVAPDGSFWAGSYVPEARAGSGALWRVDASGAVRRQIVGVTISNGLDWYADDEASMLYADSASGGVDKCLIADDGTVASRERFIDVAASDGVPDGLTIDDQGNVWVAIWGAGEVRCYDSDGRLQDIVSVPTPHVASCVLGGADRKTLFITTAREDLDDPGPLDGRLYAYRAPHGGQKPSRFR
jgi:sugar lactone lactonase YvrE